MLETALQLTRTSMSEYQELCICYMAHLCSAKWLVFVYLSDELLRTPYRNCPKRVTSNTPTPYFALVREAKRTENDDFGGPSGYAVDPSEAFRTVS